MKLFLDPMPALRIAARAQADSWFNDRARENLHNDLAEISIGKPVGITARESHRQKVMAKIDAIAAPAELEAFLADISKV